MGHVLEGVQVKTACCSTYLLHKSVLAALSTISTLNITQNLNLESEFQAGTIPKIIASCPGVLHREKQGSPMSFEKVCQKPITSEPGACLFWVELFKIRIQNAKYWQVVAAVANWKPSPNDQSEERSPKKSEQEKIVMNCFPLNNILSQTKSLLLYPKNKVGFCLWWSLHACPWIQLISGSKCHSGSRMCLKPGPVTHNFHRLQIISVLTPSKTD